MFPSKMHQFSSLMLKFLHFDRDSPLRPKKRLDFKIYIVVCLLVTETFLHLIPIDKLLLGTLIWLTIAVKNSLLICDIFRDPTLTVNISRILHLLTKPKYGEKFCSYGELFTKKPFPCKELFIELCTLGFRTKLWLKGGVVENYILF